MASCSRFTPRRRIYNRGPSFRRIQQSPRPGRTARSAEPAATSIAMLSRRNPWMNSRGVSKPKLPRDVVLHHRRRRRRERDDGSGPQRRKMLADIPVIRPEIVAPLPRCNAPHRSRPGTVCAWRASPGKPFTRSRSGAMNRKSSSPLRYLRQTSRDVVAIAPRVDALGRKSQRLQLGDLIFHQRNQRTDNQRRAAAA